MEYRELSKIYYADATNARDTNLEAEYRRRIEADSTFRLGFDTPQGELFIATPRELTVLSEAVLRAERKISNLLNALPSMASGAVLRGLVLDEIMSTNAIEDIHSTRREVKDALNSAGNAPVDANRFRELATLYLNIIDGRAKAPSTPEDVRAIYDEVTYGEIPDDKLPDGRLFRAQGVNIVQGGARVIHSGLEPESTIVEAVEKMIALSRSPEIPALYRGLAAHYLFEYIHPFYDGNGRTGRYLLSLLLSESLSSATALSLSRIIAENREAYYRAFKTTEKPLNRGELTFFVTAMLELIREAQLQLERRLEHNAEALTSIERVMVGVSADLHLKEQDSQVVFMLMQYEAFGLLGEAPLADIAAHLGLKEQMTRKHVASLEELGVVVKRRKRSPMTFALSDEFKEHYGADWLGKEES